MKRIPMMLQLALILFCVMAIPMAILTWYSGAQILQNSQSAIAESSLAGLNANRKLNENAMNNLAQDAVRLSATKIYDRIRPFESFEALNASYANVSQAQAVLLELLNLNHRVDGVYSTFFHLSDSDYVVSTDKGITTLERYESIDWIGEALVNRRGIGGVWYPRRLSSGVDVLSYVLPLNRLLTTTRGVLVVNLRESQIGEYLRTSEPGKHGYLLMDSDGTLISHNDKSLVLSDGKQLPYIEDILTGSSREGYAFHEIEGERLIYTWSRSSQFGWWNVNIYSMDELMTKSHGLQRNIVLLTIIIIAAGTVLTVFLATWLSKPVRELARLVRARSKNMVVSNKNELVFLNAAFRRIQDEEEGLYKLLQEKEQDARSLAIHHLLQGEVSKQIAELFPAPYYRVAVVSIDGYRRYVNKTNPETRNYHRFLFITKCESSFAEETHARCVYQGEGSFAIVVNYGATGSEAEGMEAIESSLAAIRDEAAELFGQSVTIGISSRAEESVAVSELAVEALEAIKHRMIEGGGSITYWKQETDVSAKYVYPANSERRILNFLDSGDEDSLMKELEQIRSEIRSVDYISYDNILFIYHQLVGVTIKHLRENNNGTSRIFSGMGNIYSAIASFDTLDELEEYLRGFYAEIIQHLARRPSEVNHGERIIRYLEEHFREEIVFEDMAKEIGISYSYMRKIVYELTGKSLIDYTNQLRIDKAKQLLLESDLTISQIATEVGYYNIQSFNRFFRKYEGMPPSGYRALKQGAQEQEREDDE